MTTAYARMRLGIRGHSELGANAQPHAARALIRALSGLLVGVFAAGAHAQAPDPEPLQSLPRTVQAVLERHNVPADSLSVYVHEIGEAAPLLALQAQTARNPASTMKLLTTFAALELLGPAYTWNTELHLMGNLSSGVLQGDLLLRGGGDPYLVQEKIWAMLRRLRMLGVLSIDGDLLLDDTFFAPQTDDPGAFDGQPFRAYNVLPNALMMNFQSLLFRFSPNRARGTVDIRFDPPVEGLIIDNRLKLGSGRCGGYQRGIAVDALMSPDGPIATFSGTFPAACRSYYMTRSVMPAEQFSYGVFRAIWEEMGGTITGGMRRGIAPVDKKPLLKWPSPPLAEVIRSVNKNSNNPMTRHLLLTMGAEHAGVPGAADKGVAAVRGWLTRNNLQFPELVLDNGAGLSRETRISAESMGRLLLHAFDSPYRAEFIASLPLSAMDGTLKKRFDYADMAGKLHLKTGRLDHVFAMAGYARSHTGRQYVVVALHNYEDVHRGAGMQAQEALMRWLFYL